MRDDHEKLDLELSQLAQALRGGDHMLACLQLAEFALKLDIYIRREERAFSFAYSVVGVTPPHAVAFVQREHTSLRQLVSSIASALDRADDRRGVEIVGKLRSVLLLHMMKEELILAPVSRMVH